MNKFLYPLQVAGTSGMSIRTFSLDELLAGPSPQFIDNEIFYLLDDKSFYFFRQDIQIPDEGTRYFSLSEFQMAFSPGQILLPSLSIVITRSNVNGINVGDILGGMSIVPDTSAGVWYRFIIV